MNKVYFRKINSYSNTEEINRSIKIMLENIKPDFKGYLPLKVHFGEKGNNTFIEPKNFKSLISYFKKNNTNPFYIETNVLYKGERTKKENHIRLAKEHGFNDLDIVIADGEIGEEYREVEINKKHFKKCKIATEIVKSKQMVVISHFKGHALSGFGGALKQLGMGCAARGGKLDMHSNSKPIINPLKCRKCGTCVNSCPTGAINLTLIPTIDSTKCIGCAKCIAVCPYGAMKVNWLSTLPKTFNEKLAEYAYAATVNKKILYISFLLNITKECDCIGKDQKTIAKDIGILISYDPVAIDNACFDLLEKYEGKKIFSGKNILKYAETLGLGSTEYLLEEI
jgi:uncharacterized protein